MIDASLHHPVLLFGGEVREAEQEDCCQIVGHQFESAFTQQGVWVGNGISQLCGETIPLEGFQGLVCASLPLPPCTTPCRPALCRHRRWAPASILTAGGAPGSPFQPR